VLALDRGPGIRDVARALDDGFSTAGTAGTGLGSVRRQSQLFDLWTAADAGTVLLARVLAGGGGAQPADAAALSVAKSGELVCGDAWSVLQRGPRTLALVADGLGHGPDAAHAALRAVAALEQHPDEEPAAILTVAQKALRGTRGAAVSVARLDPDAGELVYCGIGNVAGFVVTEERARGLLAHYGTVGADERKPREERVPLPPGALVLLVSDGIRPRWQHAAYAGLWHRDPALVAAVLYRDFANGRDDATIVAVRSR
jgi:hypothetical protein